MAVKKTPCMTLAKTSITFENFNLIRQTDKQENFTWLIFANDWLLMVTRHVMPLDTCKVKKLTRKQMFRTAKTDKGKNKDKLMLRQKKTRQGQRQKPKTRTKTKDKDKDKPSP